MTRENLQRKPVKVETETVGQRRRRVEQQDQPRRWGRPDLPKCPVCDKRLVRKPNEVCVYCVRSRTP